MKKVGYKWSGVHCPLEKIEKIRKHLPETDLFNEQVLWDYLTRYGSVILKPSGGTGGTGIIKITSSDMKQFRFHYGTLVVEMDDWKKVLSSIHRIGKELPSVFLVQQYIPLAKINESPFDVRVTLEKTPKSAWNIVGEVARVAPKGKFVTNYHQGGRVVSISNAIKNSTIEKTNFQSIVNKLNEVSLLTMKVLGKSCLRNPLAGLDFGFDNSGKVWLIEANPKPHPISYSICKKFGIPKNIAG